MTIPADLSAAAVSVLEREGSCVTRTGEGLSLAMSLDSVGSVDAARCIIAVGAYLISSIDLELNRR